MEYTPQKTIKPKKKILHFKRCKKNFYFDELFGFFISENKSKSKKEETFIEKNRNVILENFEPMSVEQTDFANLFGKDDMADIHKIGGRKDRAEYVLTLCDRLPKEKREIACAHLERSIPMSKEKPSQEKYRKLLLINTCLLRVKLIFLLLIHIFSLYSHFC